MTDILVHPALTHTPQDVKAVEAATGRTAVWIADRGPRLHLLTRDELVMMIVEDELEAARRRLEPPRDAS